MPPKRKFRPEVDRYTNVHLTRIGALKNCKPDRSWFQESCQRSRGEIALAMAQRDGELERILSELDDEGLA
jgi:hypothetical protein